MVKLLVKIAPITLTGGRTAIRAPGAGAGPTGRGCSRHRPPRHGACAAAGGGVRGWGRGDLSRPPRLLRREWMATRPPLKAVGGGTVACLGFAKKSTTTHHRHRGNSCKCFAENPTPLACTECKRWGNQIYWAAFSGRKLSLEKLKVADP